jgi:hypothetical protein
MKKKTIYTLTLALTVMAVLSGAAELHAKSNDALVGSWVVTVRPDGSPSVTNLAIASADGTLTNSDPAFGTGVGTWEAVGGREYVVKFVHLVSSSAGLPPGTAMLVVRGSLKAKSSGKKVTGPFVTTFVDGDGNELASFAGTVRLIRIEMD